MAEKTRVWCYHKPPGTITTVKDPQGRPTVFDKLPADMPRVVSVGRLDFNTEGLRLLTNDGELARHLELPQNAWPRRYRVRVHGHADPQKLASIVNGLRSGVSGTNPSRSRSRRVGRMERTTGSPSRSTKARTARSAISWRIWVWM